jgi:hypothetical protein
MTNDSEFDGYTLVKDYWSTALGTMFSDRTWRRWLHDGVVQGVPRAGGSPSPRDMSALMVGGRSVVAPVWIAPGQAEDTVSLNLGYGRRELGGVANGAGVDAYALQASANPWFVSGAEVAKFGGRRLVYSTQDHGSLDPGVDPASPKDDSVGSNPGRGYPVRPIVRETTVEGFKPVGHGTSSTSTHPLRPSSGCNDLLHRVHRACVAENNIPVVGRKAGRQRPRDALDPLDRYYTGPEGGPAGRRPADVVPALRDAPCENVCPVAATRTAPRA